MVSVTCPVAAVGGKPAWATGDVEGPAELEAADRLGVRLVVRDVPTKETASSASTLGLVLLF